MGRAFNLAIQELLDKTDGFVFMSVRLESKPEWVYVFGASRNVETSELQSRINGQPAVLLLRRLVIERLEVTPRPDRDG